MRNRVFNELIMQLSKSENDLKKANDTYENLLNYARQKLPRQVAEIIEDNHDLDLFHRLCEEDIANHKEDLKKLTELKKKNDDEILKLKQENENLKNKKGNIVKKDIESYKDFLETLKDLSKKLGLDIRKSSPHEYFNDVDKNKEEKQKINLDKIKKMKEVYEKKFKELKNKSNEYNNNIEKQNKIINEYKEYLNEINIYMNTFKERINISVINSATINDMNTNKQFDEINKQVDVVSKILVKLDEVLFQIKNIFGQNIENLLNEIQTNLNNLDKEEYQNENDVKTISDAINRNFEEIQKIISNFEKDRDYFFNKNHNVEEEMKKLKNLHEQYAKEYKKKREMNKSIIQQSILNNNINNNNNNQNQNNQNNINNQNNNNDDDINKNILRPKKTLGESFLYTIKNPKSKADLYKTVNLFGEKEEDLLEKYLDEAQLLRKNYHVICYVYDDYDLYDIYYDLKAVGLGNYEFFPKCTQSFYYDRKIEIQSFLIDGVPSKYRMLSHAIEFGINLRNFETIKVHMRYKSTKDKSTLSRGEIEERSIYRTDTYGLDRSLAGQMGKFSLILKGSFDIVNFSEYFLIRNTNNVNEIEYVWGGRIPYEGRTTLIMFSKKEATWSFCFSSKFHTSGSGFRNTKYFIPIEFIGGNNEIININPHSPQSSNVFIDEENRQYIAEYKNSRYRQAEFMIKGELKNKCKGEWFIDLTDEEVERRMDPADVASKSQLKAIATKIIQEFDKENKDSDFEFLDYMKIGLWVKKNIRYDLNYVGQTQYTALDIYNKRVGVCSHFTRLSNALLYSLGYKVIYVSGYCCQRNKSFKTDTGHAWSLIKLKNNKWYPFDSTWGIFTGKLPVGHIFGTFFGKHSKLYGYDHVQFDEQKMEGKFIEE